MSIDGLGQSNILKLRQAAAQGNNFGVKKPVSEQQKFMSKDGSIFDAPKQDSAYARRNSIPDLQNQQNSQVQQKPLTQSTSQTQTAQSQQANKSDVSASDGAAAIASAQGSFSQTKSGTKQTESNTKTINNIGTSSKQLASQISRDEKNMQKSMNISQNLVNKNNAKIASIADKIQAEAAEQEKLTEELNSLESESKYSVYSLSFAGSNGDGDGTAQAASNDNSDKIKSVQLKLSTSSAKIAGYSGSIARLQATNGRTIKMMNKTSRAYQKRIARNQNTIKENQKTSDKIMNVANTVGEVSQYTSLGGQGIQVVAKIMRYVGEAAIAGGAFSFGISAAAGEALVAASIPVEETGVVIETAGNYGTAAASTTKAAVCAANGDIQGAFTNAAMAAMTATAAVKGTKEIAGGFEGIKDQAANAIKSGQEAAAKAEAPAAQAPSETPAGQAPSETPAGQAPSETGSGTPTDAGKEATSADSSGVITEGSQTVAPGSTTAASGTEVASEAEQKAADAIENADKVKENATAASTSAENAADAAETVADDAAKNKKANWFKQTLGKLKDAFKSVDEEEMAANLKKYGTSISDTVKIFEQLGVFNKKNNKVTQLSAKQIAAKQRANQYLMYANNSRVMQRRYA